MGFFKNLFMPTGTLPVQQREVTQGVPDSTVAQAPAQGSGSFEQNIVMPRGFNQALTIGAFHRAVTLEAKTVV